MGTRASRVAPKDARELKGAKRQTLALSCDLKTLITDCQKLTDQKIACVVPTTVYRQHLTNRTDKHDWECLMTAFSFVATEPPVFQLSTILEWVKVNAVIVISSFENWKRLALLLPEDNDENNYFYRKNLFSELVRLYNEQIKELGELNGPHFSNETIESLSLLLLERNRWFFQTSFI
jgi:hypothetical protein